MNNKGSVTSSWLTLNLYVIRIVNFDGYVSQVSDLKPAKQRNTVGGMDAKRTRVSLCPTPKAFIGVQVWGSGPPPPRKTFKSRQIVTVNTDYWRSMLGDGQLKLIKINIKYYLDV